MRCTTLIANRYGVEDWVGTLSAGDHELSILVSVHGVFLCGKHKMFARLPWCWVFSLKSKLKSSQLLTTKAYSQKPTNSLPKICLLSLIEYQDREKQFAASHLLLCYGIVTLSIAWQIELRCWILVINAECLCPIANRETTADGKKSFML